MANKVSMLFALSMLIGALFQGSVAQTTHTVGGTTGWIIPSSDPAKYTTWASQQNFAVGDILVFNFAAGSHDVAEVTKAAFDGCTTANPISSAITGPANITLTTAGVHYFICTFPAHCGAGQKLSVTVSAATTTTPPPPSTTTATSSPPPPSTTTTSSSPPPPPSTTTASSPPPPSSASSSTAFTLPIILFSAVIGFLFL